MNGRPVITIGYFNRGPIFHRAKAMLAGDTFAHGRLTNRTHPMSEHFETFHVIQTPKYPPRQGLALAMGQTLSGYAIVGVWISTALACAAVRWMMCAWLPPSWALTGAFHTALHPVVLEWSQSYWGGSVALGGGALVFGALGRILREPRVYHGVAMALGMAAVFLAVLLLAGAATAFYNFRVTGHPLRLPYQVHEGAYGGLPPCTDFRCLAGALSSELSLTAPAASLLFLSVLWALRHARLWRWRERPLGRSLVRVCLLKRQGGRHLVIVRYGPKRSPCQEWVYNEADIDRSRVVRAREMDASRNRALLEYFQDRDAWFLSVDDDAASPRLVPYTAQRRQSP